jgi:hypothetical protein
MGRRRVQINCSSCKNLTDRKKVTLLLSARRVPAGLFLLDFYRSSPRQLRQLGDISRDAANCSLGREKSSTLKERLMILGSAIPGDPKLR